MRASYLQRNEAFLFLAHSEGKEMNPNSKYDRIEVVRELERRGLHAKYYHGTQVISHFEAPENVVLGLKVLGMLDYLKARIVRRGHSSKNGLHNDHHHKKHSHHKDHQTIYAWFSTREAAAIWIEEQRTNPHLGFTILRCEVFQTEDMNGYRACISGNGTV